MSLQSFVSGVTVATAAWLNQIDVFVNTLFAGATTAAQARTAISAQTQDADLDAIAALTSAANKVPYATGAQTWALADFTAAGRALVDDADAITQRATLGLTYGPTFKAISAVNQSIGTSTDTKVTLGTVSVDTNSNFASSKFTATIAGYYQINGQVFGAQNAAGIVYAQLYKNGGGISTFGSFTTNNAATGACSNVSAIIFLAVADYVELYCWQNSGGALNILSGFCRMDGALLRPT